MTWIFLIAFVCSAVAMLVVVSSARHHAHWSADSDLSGPQKMHVKVVPRVGGVGIIAGLLGGVAVIGWLGGALSHQALLFLVCTLPGFACGIWEDFTKAISPRRRMVALALSGLLGVLLLDVEITHTGWAWFDNLLAENGLLWIGPVSAVFAVTGVSNSLNIIDGMNGLASGCSVLITAVLAYVAWRVGDDLVRDIALVTTGATLGFFVWNYPRGLVFLGDGGAYLLGLVSAQLGILLTARHPQVSMLAPLMLVGYPVLETLFTMYRRRVIQRRPMTAPDGIHLHTLIYRRLRRNAVDAHGVRDATRANSSTSPYLWGLNAIVVLPVMLWWDNTPMLALSLGVFVLVYLDAYWRIVTFRSRSWSGRRRSA